MVRKYTASVKRPHKRMDSSELTLALDKIKNGQSINSVAKEFGFNRSTLQRRIQMNGNGDVEAVHSGFKRTFNSDQELAIHDYIVNAQNRLLGFTAKQIRKLAYDFAEKMQVPHRFNKDTGMAGNDWLHDFMKRHKLSYRKAEHTSTARANGFNKEAVKEFFDILEEIFLEKKIEPRNIYNVDETGITVNPKSTSKIIAKQGVKQCGGLTAAERGETVTAVLCMSATGNFMPPMLIFPRVNPNPQFLAGAPSGAWGEFHRSGWITEELFTKWFKEFIKFSRASKDNPVLLTLDGHSSHINNLKVLDLGLEHNVEIVSFPPHCTHRMQPLDVVMMKPVSHFYTEFVREQQMTEKVQMKHIFNLFGKAWTKASVAETAINGFRVTGIVPFNRNVFKESDFVVLRSEASKVTENPVVREYVQVLEEIKKTDKHPESTNKNVNTLPGCRNSNAPDFQNIQSSKDQAITFLDMVTKQLTGQPPSNLIENNKPESVVEELQAARFVMNFLIDNVIQKLSGSSTALLNNENLVAGVEDISSDNAAVLQKADMSHDNINIETSDFNSNQPVCQEVNNNVLKKSRKGKAARITTEDYKQNLVAKKLKTSVKKEPIDKKRKAKPKISSNVKLESPLVILPATRKRKNQTPASKTSKKKRCDDLPVSTDAESVSMTIEDENLYLQKPQMIYQTEANIIPSPNIISHLNVYQDLQPITLSADSDLKSFDLLDLPIEIL